MDLGTRIRHLREESGMTQLAFAKILNISNSTLSQYESGDRIPSDDMKIRIADHFQVSMDYLLCRTDQKEQPPTDVDERLLDAELIGLLTSLTPEEQGKVDAFVKGMIASRADGPSPQRKDA